MFSTSREFIQTIKELRRDVLTIDPLLEVLKRINNPQNQLKCIHVTGTNGKGSTSCMIQSILMEAGYKVGIFNSPSLVSHHDMIRMNRTTISEETFLKYANQYNDLFVEYKLSFFEIQVCISFCWFLEEKADYVILEVGLGGIQDATNVMTPLVSVITNIGMDHMDYLGDSKEDIACAKAGIIKENIPCITMEKDESCLDIFRNVCEEKHAKLIICEEPENVYVDTCLHFDYKNYKNIKQNTLALYQAKNTSLAIEAVHQFISIDEQTIRAGILHMNWPGRFECISQAPFIILDGAHNKEGMDALVKSCQNLKNLHVLFTALADKPNHDMLEMLLGISNQITVCEFEHERKDKAERIAGSYPVRVIKDWKLAIPTMIKEAKEDPILICGSLYFISQVREYLKEEAL